MNVAIPKNVNTRDFWMQNNLEYKYICHSIPATQVISAIVSAHDIPVLAHPMESLSSKNENVVEMFILSLGICTVELITPKHTNQDIKLIRNIINRNDLSGSIGSDSHKSVLTEIPYEYDIHEKPFEWIRNLANS